MDSKKTSSLTKMEKIGIVVEYSELSEDKKADYLKKHGIDQKTLKAYQKEAASILGVGMNPEPPRPKTRCEELIDDLVASNENVRRDAAKELGYMRHKAIAAVDALIDQMLTDEIDFVRSWSSWALTRIDPRNPDVIEAFLQGIAEDEDSLHTRSWCVVGLSVSESDHARSRLIKLLKNGKPFAQFASIETLSRMKVDSVEFVEGLKLATDSENDSLRELANRELSAIQAED